MVIETTPGTVWEAGPQGCEYQEAGTPGEPPGRRIEVARSGDMAQLGSQGSSAERTGHVLKQRLN